MQCAVTRIIPGVLPSRNQLMKPKAEAVGAKLVKVKTKPAGVKFRITCGVYGVLCRQTEHYDGLVVAAVLVHYHRSDTRSCMHITLVCDLRSFC